MLDYTILELEGPYRWLSHWLSDYALPSTGFPWWDLKDSSGGWEGQASGGPGSMLSPNTGVLLLFINSANICWVHTFCQTYGIAKDKGMRKTINLPCELQLYVFYLLGFDIKFLPKKGSASIYTHTDKQTHWRPTSPFYRDTEIK